LALFLLKQFVSALQGGDMCQIPETLGSSADEISMRCPLVIWLVLAGIFILLGSLTTHFIK
jgi:hypothetical protein